MAAGTDAPRPKFLFERLDVTGYGFDVVGAQFGERFHLRLVAYGDAFLDGFGNFFIGELGFDLRIGEILDAGFLAHFCGPFAIGPVAFGAIGVEYRLAVGCQSVTGDEHE